MFSFGADGMGYILLTDSAHSPRRTPPLLSLHQPLPLPLFLSISVKLDLSLAVDFLSLFLCFSSLLDTTYRRPVIIMNGAADTGKKMFVLLSAKQVLLSTFTTLQRHSAVGNA